MMFQTAEKNRKSFHQRRKYAKIFTAFAILVACAGLAASQNHGNRLRNPDFDSDIAHWNPSYPGSASWDSSFDVDDNSDSGSVLIVKEENSTTTISLFADCVLVDAETEYEFGAWTHVNSGSTGESRTGTYLIFYGTQACEGIPLSTAGSSEIAQIERWYLNAGRTETPAGSVSASFAILISGQFQDRIEAHLDSAFLLDSEAIFKDGFETGDMGSWSRDKG